MKRRMLALALILALVLAMMPVTALAAGTIPAEGGALTSGAYTLTEDVVLTAPLTVAVGEEVTIDLNGFDLSYTCDSTAAVSMIDNDGTLTITDGSQDQDGAVVLTIGADAGGYAAADVVSNDGTLTLSGGTLKVSTDVARPLNGVRTSAEGAKTVVDGGTIWVEQTGTSASKAAYGIYGDKIVDMDVELKSGQITVKNTKGVTYGIHVKGAYPPAGMVTLSGGSVDVVGNGNVYGVYVQYSGLDMFGTDITVISGTSTAYGVHCQSANENREISGGSVTVTAQSVANGIYNAVSAQNLEVTDCSVIVNASNANAAQYCSISGGSYTAQKMTGCTVTGGDYSFDPAGSYEPYVYEATEAGGWWTVVPYSGAQDQVLNQRTGVGYASLSAAVTAAEPGDVLQLQKDYDLQGHSATIDKGVTLDLNGYEIMSTGTVSDALVVSGGTTDCPVVVTDTKATGHADAGTISGINGITVESGSVTVEKINIQAASFAGAAGVNVKDTADVTLRGVQITATSNSTSGGTGPKGVWMQKGNGTLTAEDLDSAFPLVFNISTDTAGLASAFAVDSGSASINVQSGTFTVNTAKNGGSASVAYIPFSASCNIYGGSYTVTAANGSAEVAGYNASKVKISGGCYTVDPSNCLADGYSVVTEGVPAGYTYLVKAEDVAQVGENFYNNLQDAIDAAAGSADKTVTLIRDVVSNNTVTIPADVTIDKGTYSLSFNGSPAVILEEGVTMPQAIAELNAFDAMVERGDGSKAYYVNLSQALAASSQVKLARDVEIQRALSLSSSHTIDFNGYDLTSADDTAFDLIGYMSVENVEISFLNTAADQSVITGGIDVLSQNYIFTFTLGENVEIRDNCPLFLQGNGKNGCITANIYGGLTVEVDGQETTYAAIQGNGQDQYGGTVINIYDGAKVNGTESAGIYHPQSGTLNVYGGEVTGNTGIYFKSGTLNVTGGVISGTGADTAYQYNGSGFYPTGDALVVDNCGYPGGEPVIQVSGGEFRSQQADPVGSYKKSDDSTQTGGPAEAVGGFITGGDFSSSVNRELLDETMRYELKDAGQNPDAPYSYYATIDAAVEAAGNSATAEIQTVEAAEDPGAVTYDVTFVDEGNGTEYTITVTENETITLPAPTRSGYTLTGWKNETTGQVVTGTAVITAATRFTAQWSVVSSGGSVTSYAVTVEKSSNGSVTASVARAVPGSKVTLTVKPDEGYVLSALTVKDAAGKTVSVTESNGKYTFTMPASAVTVTASFTAAESGLPFTDVSGHWALEAIEYVYEKGMMNGTTATKFGPEAQLTRGMIVTILYRLEGEPNVSGSVFADVSAGQYYADPVAWAAANGIVTGYTDTTFGPEDSITREQLAAILYRYASYKGYDVTASADLGAYTDAGSVSAYAVDAMAWANAEGLITGVTASTLQPKGTATRAQVATILMRFCENIAK